MKTKITKRPLKRMALMVLLMLVSPCIFAQNESDFYTETIHLVDQTVNLVTDYGANGTDTQDDSPQLLQAISDMGALANGGKIVIPSGTFYLEEILLQSNVHLEIDPGATIIPPDNQTGNYSVFRLSAKTGASELDEVSNVSIRGTGGQKFTVDLRNLSNKNVAVANTKNSNNFMVADFHVLDDNTKFSVVTVNLAEHNGTWAVPQNGVVKNISAVTQHYGYGIVQVQVGLNILFKDLSGEGGVTLRLESGASLVSTTQPTGMDQIYGRNLHCDNGNGTVMISPHEMQNGHVDIDGVTAVNTGFAVRIGKGFTKFGNPLGTFAGTSIVKNVHAIYGETAQVKSKHFKYMPCEIRGLISSTFNPDGESYSAPAMCAVLNTAEGSGPGYYNVNVSAVTQDAFVYDQKVIRVEADAVTDTECGTATASYTYSSSDPSVTFDGSGSSDSNGSIVEWFWNYGDGTTGVGQNSNHTYSTNGDYNVQLQVTDDAGGTDSQFQTVTITGASGNNAPVSSFTYTATNLSVDFDGSGSTDSDGTITNYDWDFGDGNTGTGVTVNHVFAAAGDYTVALTVTDNGGATDVSSQLVSVTAGSGGLVLGGIYKISAVHSSKAMTVQGAGNSNNTPVVQETYTGASHQQWQLQENGTGFYQLFPMHNTSKALKIRQGSSSVGEEAVVFNHNTGNALTWEIIDLGNGYHKIVNKKSGLSLEVENGSSTEGAAILQNNYSGSTHMQWQFDLLSGGARTGDKQVEEAMEHPTFLAYPNPVGDIMNLRFDKNQGLTEVRIFDLSGRSVFQRSFDNLERDTQINVGFLKQGLYKVVIRTQESGNDQNFNLLKR